MYGILCNNKVMLGIDLCDECEKKKHMIKSVEIIIPKVNEATALGNALKIYFIDYGFLHSMKLRPIESFNAANFFPNNFV